jgi:hypothetical protein
VLAGTVGVRVEHGDCAQSIVRVKQLFSANLYHFVTCVFMLQVCVLAIGINRWVQEERVRASVIL